MSQVLPQSKLGKIVTKPLVDGFARIDVANSEALEILNLSPVSTVWGRSSGRPIYDRLPGISQGYREEYFGEVGRGLVYVEPQFGVTFGPGSLEVGALQNDPRVLVVYNGTITWAYGQIQTDTLAVNLETIIDGGIQDGSYQVGYYLNQVSPDEAKYSKYEVQNYSLGASQTIYFASAEAKYHPVLSIFSEPTDGSWTPTEFFETGAYSDGSQVIMDFTESVVAREFSIEATSSGLASAKCALYASDDAVIWNLEDSVSSRNGIWSLQSPSEVGYRYFKFFFWDGTADVSEVRYSGEAVFRVQRPTGFTSEAEIFLEGEYDEIDRPHITLAIFTVGTYEISKIRDTRSQTSVKYEPVASWLTDFQDSTLRSLVSSIEGYSSLYMSPSKGGELFYERLLEENFALESDTTTPQIIFPSGAELEPGWTAVGEAALGTEPIGDVVATDPQGFVIIGTEIPFSQSDSSVRPNRIILLSDPTLSSSLANKAYTDSALIPSLDNGKY